jgi:integrase
VKHSKRTRVATGIYRDACGFLAVASRRGLRRDQRFPPDTAIAFMQSWQIRTCADLADEADDTRAIDEPVPERGTFAQDLPRRLKQIEGRASYKADRSHLRAWLPFVGPKKRTAIRPSHVRAAFAAWTAAGKSPRTIRHRRRVLRELYHGLDGAHARPPLKGVKVPKPEDPHPTPVPLATIQKVAASLKRGKVGTKRHGPKRTLARVTYAEPAKARARFLVRATTGQRPSQIMRAKPGDVDLTRRIWFVRAGKGGHAIPLPLTPDMVRAWKAFAAAGAWGTFDSRSFSKTLRRHGWPTGVRPYNLRHTFAIDHLLAGTSLGDLQGLLGHRQIETTRRHYAPVLLALLKKTVGKRTLKLA